MNALIAHHWAFGGPLAGVPPTTAWTVLACVAALVALLAYVSYRCSVVKSGIGWAVTLTFLRLGTVAVLLLCLANPLRVERLTREPPPPPPPLPPQPIAVVVDRSASMTQPDNRGRTRLDDALSTWRRFEPIAKATFAAPRYFSFADDLQPAPTLDVALARTGGADGTRLYRSVAKLLHDSANEHFGAVVVLTDGVDTSGDSDTLLRDAAVETGTPVYFVVGNNRAARIEPFLRVREWQAPGAVVRSTMFTLDATFEAFSRMDRVVAYSLWQGTRRVEGGQLALTTGSNLTPRSFTVNAGEPGVLDFTLRLGDTADAPIVARSVTRVLDARPVRVLVYQGALDWGFRYLNNALRTDNNFQVATVVTPDVGVTLARDTKDGGRLVGRLAEEAKRLESFDCIILAQTQPQQLTDGQQRALVEFTQAGGSVLIIAPGTDAVPRYDGPLQDIIPVNFSSAMPRRAARSSAAELKPFAPTETGLAAPVFARGRQVGGVLPQFASFVPVASAKPGAEVLAVHPEARDPDNDAPYILLATERFGRGRSAYLATDALWRWKMHEPSASTAVETFWQQLILMIGRRKDLHGLQFLNAPAQVRVGQTVTLQLGGVESDRIPTVAAKTPGGAVVPLPVKFVQSETAPWTVEWTPDKAGSWELAAVIEGAFRAHIFPNVTAQVTGELAPSTPPVTALRTLAGDTGGALLTHEPPAAWLAAGAAEKPLEPVVSERKIPEWNRWELLWLALGLFGVELVVRRIRKLL